MKKISSFSITKSALSFLFGMMVIFASAYLFVADKDYIYLDKAPNAVISDFQESLENPDSSEADNLPVIFNCNFFSISFFTLAFTLLVQALVVLQQKLLRQIRPRSPPTK